MRDANDFSGAETPRSGGFKLFPGDVKSDKYLIESKFTEKNSWSISLATWDKVRAEALLSRKLPMISLELPGQELVIMDKNDFLELTEDK